MIYVEAPEEYTGELPGVFLAGGITDCPLWQPDAVALLTAGGLRGTAGAALFNPRRAQFPMAVSPNAAFSMDGEEAGVQIGWEFRHLRRAAVVLFWFASGPSPQPITLYELGTQAATGKPIAVGCDPAYLRRADVVHQLALLRPEVPVRDSLESTCSDALALLAARRADGRAADRAPEGAAGLG